MMTTETTDTPPQPAAVGAQVQRGVRPRALLLAHTDGRETLHPIAEYAVAYRDTAVSEALLYDQAAFDAAVAAERAESARLRHLLNLARDDYNTAAQRLQDIGDYAHDHSTGPAVPDDLWEVRSMAYGSGA